MINIADLPAVREQLARDAAAKANPAPAAPVPVEYVRAPAAPGPQSTGSRPSANPGATR